MDRKVRKIKDILKTLKRVVIAYSGGLDSAFLLKIAVDTLGKGNVLAVTARSETYPESEYREAVRIAKRIGARHLTIHTEELKIKNFKSNPVNRCYYCKSELFSKLDKIRGKYGMAHLLDGTNYDDLKDVRHGRKAAVELGVRSPLLEAKVKKSDIRKFSKSLKLPTWDKPAFACLASRFPFNSRITKRGLRKVEEAEEALRKMGFKQVRVRLHGDMARLELTKKDFIKAVRAGDAIVSGLKKLGIIYISLDLSGYRTGSMHEALL
ncbi:MAG: ATP-dependent sacrificial sulfur transferase LarE [Candidatus Omnitrophota bacterium]|nr:ATP-dependent sacrificial sulfur transferase LarE [Candidatus Omnitrophota bacterium]